MLAESLLTRLQGVRKTGRDSWVAKCPAHEDRSPSLAIRDVGDRVLIHCHAGCGAAEVVTALGLDMADLFERGADKYEGRQRRTPLDARAMLAVLARDVVLAYTAASRLARGERLSERDCSALLAAAGRIRHAAAMAGAL